MKTEWILMACIAIVATGCDPMRRDQLTSRLPPPDAPQVLVVSSNRAAVVEAVGVVAATHDLTALDLPGNRTGGVVVAYRDAKHDGHFTVTVRESKQPGQYQVEIFEMPAFRRSRLSKSIEAEIKRALPDMF